jgi:hypothetical protein
MIDNDTSLPYCKGRVPSTAHLLIIRANYPTPLLSLESPCLAERKIEPLLPQNLNKRVLLSKVRPNINGGMNHEVAFGLS